MICNKCGMMNPDGQQFCGNCGSPLMMPSQPMMPPPIAKKDNKNTILIVIAVLLGVIVGVLIVWLVVSSRNSGKTVEDDDDDDIVIEVVDKKSERAAAYNSLPQSQSSLDVIADGDYSSSYLSDDYLSGFSKKELRVMRNAIYARHGRYFQSSDLQQIFGRKGWYSPYQQEVPVNELNAVEKANIKKIQSWEKVK